MQNDLAISSGELQHDPLLNATAKALGKPGALRYMAMSKNHANTQWQQLAKIAKETLDNHGCKAKHSEKTC
jgi:hypothetical protein